MRRAKSFELQAEELRAKQYGADYLMTVAAWV
jgi:hypothetical protein